MIAADTARLPTPRCPLCAHAMVIRRREPRTTFWGCSRYPATGCRGQRRYDPPAADPPALAPLDTAASDGRDAEASGPPPHADVQSTQPARQFGGEWHTERDVDAPVHGVWDRVAAAAAPAAPSLVGAASLPVAGPPPPPPPPFAGRRTIRVPAAPPPRRRRVAYRAAVERRAEGVGRQAPLLVITYSGFAAAAIFGTLWIHPALTGVTLALYTAAFVDIVERRLPRSEGGDASREPRRGA